MANVAMNLGDKLVFDANDATNPNTTYLTNPATATNPNNTIEVWCNGAKRAEFQSTKAIFQGDVELALVEPAVRCAGGVKFYLDVNGVHPAFQSLAVHFGFPGASEPVLDVSANRIDSWFGIRFRAAAGAVQEVRQTIDSETGHITVAGGSDVKLRANWKGLDPAGRLRVFDHNVEIAAFDSAAIDLKSATTVWGDLTVTGNGAIGNLAAGTALMGTATFTADATFQAAGVFSGKVDGFASGLRTKVQSFVPSGGQSGDMVVQTGSPPKLHINVGGAWKSVSLV